MLAVSSYSYHLQKLMSPFPFDTDPKEGVRDAKVTSIKLKPHHSKGSLELTIPFDNEKSIHEVAKDWFNQYTPFREDFYIQQAQVAIRFKETENERHQSLVIPFAIGFPSGGDLKSCRERERLIADKCFKHWGLMEEMIYDHSAG